jgi:hypothetical protein
MHLLPSEKLHKFYSSPSIIRMVKENEMGRACSMNGEKLNTYRRLVVKGQLGRPRRRGVENIKMDLREIGWDGMD